MGGVIASPTTLVERVGLTGPFTGLLRQVGGSREASRRTAVMRHAPGIEELPGLEAVVGGRQLRR